jgi:hypothetical protein
MVTKWMKYVYGINASLLGASVDISLNNAKARILLTIGEGLILPCLFHATNAVTGEA